MTLRHTIDPRSPVRQQEWPRPVLAAIDAVGDQVYVYSLSVTYPAKDLEATPGTGLYALDGVDVMMIRQSGGADFRADDVAQALA